MWQILKTPYFFFIHRGYIFCVPDDHIKKVGQLSVLFPSFEGKILFPWAPYKDFSLCAWFSAVFI